MSKKSFIVVFLVFAYGLVLTHNIIPHHHSDEIVSHSEGHHHNIDHDHDADHHDEHDDHTEHDHHAEHNDHNDHSDFAKALANYFHASETVDSYTPTFTQKIAKIYAAQLFDLPVTVEVEVSPYFHTRKYYPDDPSPYQSQYSVSSSLRGPPFIS
jgi:hypothetical protein